MTGVVVGLILAGGRARRMGGADKALLRLGDASLVVRARDRLGAQTDSILLNANGDPARFAGLGLIVVADPLPGHAGPLAGVLAGMEWASIHRPGASWIVSVAVDTPFFPSDLVARLLAARGDETAIILARSGAADQLHPVFAAWRTDLAPSLRADLERGWSGPMRDWALARPHALVSFPPVALPGGPIDPFFNINTPEALAEASRRLEGQPA